MYTNGKKGFIRSHFPPRYSDRHRTRDYIRKLASTLLVERPSFRFELIALNWPKFIIFFSSWIGQLQKSIGNCTKESLKKAEKKGGLKFAINLIHSESNLEFSQRCTEMIQISGERKKMRQVIWFSAKIAAFNMLGLCKWKTLNNESIRFLANGFFSGVGRITV